MMVEKEKPKTREEGKGQKSSGTVPASQPTRRSSSKGKVQDDEQVLVLSAEGKNRR